MNAQDTVPDSNVYLRLATMEKRVDVLNGLLAAKNTEIDLLRNQLNTVQHERDGYISRADRFEHLAGKMADALTTIMHEAESPYKTRGDLAGIARRAMEAGS